MEGTDIKREKEGAAPGTGRAAGRTRKRAGGAPLSADEAMRELSDIAAGRREYPEFTSKGEEYMCLPSVSERLKALELIGKHLALFSDTAREDGEFKVEIRVVE